MRKFLVFLIILVIAFGGYYFFKASKPIAVDNDESGGTTPAIEISTVPIAEENYSGSRPNIKGEGELASAARKYIEETLTDFKEQADAEVPKLREDFGTEAPTSSYSIDISAWKVGGEKTESVIITVYVYTGGAHGGSSYKVFTASKNSGEILSLGDVVRADNREAFMSFVKGKILTWQPATAGAEGASAEPVVFKEDVENLTFESLNNWAFLNDSLVLYFSQYEIGPGVLGAFAVPIPTLEIKEFLL